MRLLAFAAVVVLTACSRPADQPKPAETPAVPPSPFSWTGNAHSLRLWDDGVELLRIECDGASGLTVHGEHFKPVGSEERMSIGAGDVVITLVATPDETVRPTAVKGEGSANADFLNAFGERRKVAVNYGYQDMGPYDGPPPELAEPFTAACMT